VERRWRDGTVNADGPNMTVMTATSWSDSVACPLAASFVSLSTGFLSLLSVSSVLLQMGSAGPSSAVDFNLTLVHSGSSYSLSLPPSTPFSVLQQEAESLTGIPIHFQKIVFKGRALGSHNGDATLQEVGLRDSAKLMVLGSRREEVEGIQSQEIERRRREEVLRTRKALNVSIPFTSLSPTWLALW
jgi:hypothetical protein